MDNDNPEYEKTYRKYISEVAQKDLDSIKGKLDIDVEGNTAVIPFLNEHFRISPEGIADASGSRPRLQFCVVLCRYILMCPKIEPNDTTWTAYRDFKDAGPLTVFWANDVERSIAVGFSGKREKLMSACSNLKGYPPDSQLSYEIKMQFNILPKIPVLLLFNDEDDEFPASCSVLFQKSAEKYLDGESLAIIGKLFADRVRA